MIQFPLFGCTDEAANHTRIQNISLLNSATYLAALTCKFETLPELESALELIEETQRSRDPINHTREIIQHMTANVLYMYIHYHKHDITQLDLHTPAALLHVVTETNACPLYDTNGTSQYIIIHIAMIISRQCNISHQMRWTRSCLVTQKYAAAGCGCVLVDMGASRQTYKYGPRGL